MHFEHYSLGVVGNGKLSLGPRPDAKQLTTFAQSASAAGITHVVSLIEQSKVIEFGLQIEADELEKFNIGFTHFPIDDFGLPDGRRFQSLMDALVLRLANGGSLFVHCAGGIGRAGLTVSCLLVEHGFGAKDALKKSRMARGVTVPETEEQVAFVQNWKPAKSS